MASSQGIQVVRDLPKQGRVNRTPKHHFAGFQQPWQICPFLLAPVLPGETMKNLLVQANVEGSATLGRLTGWWYEMYVFYVKHRDLDARDVVTEMHLNPQADVSSLRAGATNAAMYTAAGNIDWTKLCLERVVSEYFRDEGEGVWDYQTGGLPMASINLDNWLDSAMLEADYVPGSASTLPGENDDSEMIPDNVPAGFEVQWEQWMNMRAMQLTDATFEDYLKSFGVRPAKELREDLHRPELLRYVRDWTYPVPTTKMMNVDPPGEANPPGAYQQTVMAPRWKISERADKDRYFAEPGFIFGVSVARPKVFFGLQRGSAAGLMDNAFTWLPAVLSSEAYTSLKKVPAASGILPEATEDWWFDVKDLLVHGDQMLFGGATSGNLSLTSQVFLPTGTLNHRYASSSDRSRVVQAGDPYGTFVDGICQLTIAGRVTDTSL